MDWHWRPYREWFLLTYYVRLTSIQSPETEKPQNLYNSCLVHHSVAQTFTNRNKVFLSNAFQRIPDSVLMPLIVRGRAPGLKNLLQQSLKVLHRGHSLTCTNSRWASNNEYKSSTDQKLIIGTASKPLGRCCVSNHQVAELCCHLPLRNPTLSINASLAEEQS